MAAAEPGRSRGGRATRRRKPSSSRPTPAGDPEGRRALADAAARGQTPGNTISWRPAERLARLNRLRVFYNEHDGVKPLSYKQMLKPGQVSIIDLSDSGMSELNNLVIADLLRAAGGPGQAYQTYERAPKGSTAVARRTLIVIESALSS
jgi:hypothetical protein